MSRRNYIGNLMGLGETSCHWKWLEESITRWNWSESHLIICICWAFIHNFKTCMDRRKSFKGWSLEEWDSFQWKPRRVTILKKTRMEGHPKGAEYERFDVMCASIKYWALYECTNQVSDSSIITWASIESRNSRVSSLFDTWNALPPEWKSPIWRETFRHWGKRARGPWNANLKIENANEEERFRFKLILEFETRETDGSYLFRHINVALDDDECMFSSNEPRERWFGDSHMSTQSLSISIRVVLASVSVLG